MEVGMMHQWRKRVPIALLRRRGHLFATQGVLVSLIETTMGEVVDRDEHTGVRSRLSSSVAEAAASIRSSHRLPNLLAMLPGSTDSVLRSWEFLLACSLDFVRSCLGFRAFWDTDSF